MYKRVKENGHEVVGVFTVPDINNREDPVAAVARYNVMHFELRLKYNPGKSETKTFSGIPIPIVHNKFLTPETKFA